MASFTISIQKHQKRADGKYPVSIRLIFKRKIAYIKTEYYVTEKQLDKNLNITDKFLLRELNRKIELLDEITIRRLGSRIDLYTIKELAEYLEKYSRTGTDASIDFVEFSRSHIMKIKDRQPSRSRRLQTTLNSLIDFFGRDKISITEISAKILKEYEDYLLKPHKIVRQNQFGRDVHYDKKPLSTTGVRDYMADIRTLFNAAKEEFNDEDKDEKLIFHYPFSKYKLPMPTEAVKRSVNVEIIRKIFGTTELSYSGTHGVNRAILARDVFMLSFFLLGMNTVDLYNIDTFKDGRLTYRRTKTKDRRVDRALISVKVEPEVLPIIEKYLDATSERVFCFHQMYSTPQIFNANINKGLKLLATNLEIEEALSTYYARHSWATIARNDCRVSKDDVHMALNHVDGKMKVTDLYIAKDWTIIDDANRKVIDYLIEKETETEHRETKQFTGLTVVKSPIRKAM